LDVELRRVTKRMVIGASKCGDGHERAVRDAATVRSRASEDLVDVQGIVVAAR
jgi:hypothetical protein